MKCHLQLLFCLVVALTACCAQKQYTNENRPYEFGFKIPGEQHRQESKDEDGIIMGEFGFITGDGIYHVTVFATDKDGNYKILSMKNVRVGPSPWGKKAATDAPTTTTTTTTTTPEPPAGEFVLDGKPGCSGCLIPTPPPPGAPARKPLKVPSYKYPTKPAGSPSPVPAQPGSPSPNPAFPRPGSANPAFPRPDSANPAFPRPGSPNPAFPRPDSANPAFPRPGSPNPAFPRPDSANPAFPRPDSANPGFPRPGSPNPAFPRPDSANPAFPRPDSANPGFPRPGGSNPPFPGGNPGTPPRGPFQGKPDPAFGTGHPNPLNPNAFQPNPASPGRFPPTPGSSRPTDGLPPGVTVDDIMGLLYKFNYTVGFHGHEEKGYRNGNKEGEYYVNYRDGTARKVTYTADESGFRPKISVVKIEGEDVPREETEKEYGLKGYEFKWYNRR